MKIVHQSDSKREKWIPTIINLGGNSNTMLLDLNFGDLNFHKNHIPDLAETTKCYDFKLKYTQSYLSNFLKKIDKGKKKNSKLCMKLNEATE